MSAPNGFNQGAEVSICTIDGTSRISTLLYWRSDGVVVENDDGYHFVPFTSVISLSVDKPEAKITIGDYTKGKPGTITVGDWRSF